MYLGFPYINLKEGNILVTNVRLIKEIAGYCVCILILVLNT